MVELLIQNNAGEILDVSELAADKITLEDNIYKTSILRFDLIKNETLGAFFEGNPVRFAFDGHPYFYGYVFRKLRDKEQVISVTAYDQLRYLKAKSTFVKKGIKVSELLQQIAQEFNLKLGTVEDTGYVIPSMIEDDKVILDVLAKYIDLTLAYTKNYFVLKDNMGRIELRNVKNLVTDLVIGDGSLLIDYSYETEIDTDTYNQIKLVKNNESTGKRDVFLVRDSSTIERWGLLQYYEVLDENTNEAQAIEKAEALLKLKNRVRRNLSVEVLGDYRLRAGNVVFFDIADLGDISLKQFLLVTKATHTFTNNDHTVKAELRIL